MKPGSAILTVIMMITLIMILAGTVMRSATLFHDFALQRLVQERRVRSLQALVNYAIAWCTVIERDVKKNASYQKTFPTWPPGSGSERGEIVIQYEPGVYCVTAELKEGTSSRGAASCKVHTEKTWYVE